MDTSNAVTLVLGIGNTLLTDEAVGVRVAEYLTENPAPKDLGLKPMDGGTMGLTLLVEMEDADALIVIDAAYLNSPPGTIRVFEGPDMDHFLRTRGRNPHDIGLDDLMDGLRLREAVPKDRALIGIQPEILTVGEAMTDAVAASVPQAARMIVELVRGWKA